MNYDKLMPNTTPLLLIAWRRPETIRQLIEAIRPIAPMNVYVACDGPRAEHPDEEQKVAETRKVISNEINWSCNIHYLYSEVNHGCRDGVTRAIDWFFENVEAGIILEDDCIPHTDFFDYCSTLLSRYKHDERIWCISGGNFQDGQWRGNGTYFFSQIPLCWGWATWRRCWKNFDKKLSSWESFLKSGHLNNAFDDPLEAAYWQQIWQKITAEDARDIWDYQWVYTCISNNGLNIEPNRNLIKNIGFGKGATNTINKALAPITAIDEGIKEIIEPDFILRDKDACRYCFDNHFGGKEIRNSRKITSRIKARINNHWREVWHRTTAITR